MLEKKTIVLICVCVVLAVFVLMLACFGKVQPSDPAGPTNQWAIIQLGNGELIEGWAHNVYWGNTFVHLDVNGIHIKTGARNVILCGKKP